MFYLTLADKALKQIRIIQAQFPEYVEKTELNIMERFIILRELEAFETLFRRGVISDKVYHEKAEESISLIRQMKLRPVSELQIPPLKLLAGIPYFNEFTQEELLHLASRFKARSFLQNEVIVNEGEQGDSLFIIGRGTVEVSVRNADGKPIILSTLRAGDFFGETALLHPQPRTATVKSVSPSTLLELDRRSFLPMLEKAPKLKKILEEAYNKRQLNNLISHVPLFQNMPKETRDKLAEALETMALQKGQSFQPAEGTVYMIRHGEIVLERNDGTTHALKTGTSFHYSDKDAWGMRWKSATAENDVELLLLPKEKLDTIGSESA
jgi:CRP-like cAMP-binding protein